MNKEKQVLQRINMEIKLAANYYKTMGIQDRFRLLKIDGMLIALSIMTGKEYIITEEGAIEK